jgi:hypothetical protein
MISTNIPCRGFVLCVGYLPPDVSFLHRNNTDGDTNQALYTYSGGGFATSEGKPTKNVLPNVMTDLSDFMGNQIHYTAGREGAAWVALNPIPATKRYQTQLVSGGSAVEVTADGAECAIICLLGGINVEGKEITAQSYARVLPTKIVTLEVPQNSVALILKAI